MMKRMLHFALCLLLLCALGSTALAGEPAVGEEPAFLPGEAAEEDAEGSAPVRLSIDDENVYDGMAQPYCSGYAPTVAGGKAVVVLPLTANGELMGDQVTASVDLGDTASSPFVYQNYQKRFARSAQPVNGTDRTEEVYYVRFDLALSADRYNGVYPVTVNVSARDAQGGDISQSFVLYVTIADGQDLEAAPEEPAPVAETPTSAPVVLVTGYAVAPETVEAGSGFTATVTLKNTSSVKAVQNMVVTVETGDANFTLLNDSDTIYISKLGKGEATELELRFSTAQNTPEGTYTFALNMSYDDPEALTQSSSGRFSVQVRQPLNVELTVPAVAGTVSAGDTIPLSFQVLNLGRSEIYNVRCEVSGDGLFPTGTAFVGNMEAGSEGSASLNLFIGTKDMTDGYTGAEQYGGTTGTITLSYEDAAGNGYTQEYTFQTTIEKPVIAVTKDPEEEKRSAGQWWVSVCAGAGALAVTGAVVLVLRRKARHGS